MSSEAEPEVCPEIREPASMPNQTKGSQMIGRLVLVTGATFALSAPALAAPPTKAVATIDRSGLRAVLTAHKTSGGLSPTASVTVVGYRASGGKWIRTGSMPLYGTYFWKVITHPHAICRLKLTGTNLTVSLLETPSIGCAPALTMRVPS
jgi:hypothetical protein